MKFSLDGHVAVVTGGTRGIGREIVETFVGHGAKVVLNGRSEQKGKQALDEIDRPDDTHFVAGDASCKADMESLVDAAVERFGRLDILVNNAGGVTGHGMIREMTDDAWLGTIDLNLNSAFYATRRALHYFEPQRSGRIINISSVEGKQANKAAVSNYITTKAALNGFTKAVAFEYGPMGITCNAIAPAAIETDIMRDSGPVAASAAGITYEQFLQNYADESMIKRLNRVEEVAAMALLLASEYGSGITGAVLSVDGGSSPY
jgi:NAD(P)-dependent dehydrogenase (short-subunit alcohol dehydrogenase family)